MEGTRKPPKTRWKLMKPEWIMQMATSRMTGQMMIDTNVRWRPAEPPQSRSG